MRVARALVLAFLVAPSALAASWTHEGGDAGRTGAHDGAGPRDPEVAFLAHVPGYAYAPIVLGRMAYVPIEAVDTVPGSENAIWRVDLDRGTTERLVRMRSIPVGLASDGAALYVSTVGGAEAFDLEGRARWRWTHTPPRADAPHACLDPLVAEGRVHVLCFASLADAPALPGLPPQGAYSFQVVSLDAASGALLWTREVDAPPHPALPDLPGDAATQIWNARLSAAGGALFVFALELTPTDQVNVTRYTVSALDAESGAVRWRRSDTPTPVSREAAAPQAFASEWVGGGVAVASGNLVFLRLDQQVALNLATGEEVWARALGEQDAQETRGTTAQGVGGDGRLFITSGQSRYSLDVETGDPLWQQTFPPDSPLLYGVDSILLSDDVGIANVFLDRVPQAQEGYIAFDVATGEELWNVTFTSDTAPVGYEFTQSARAENAVLFVTDKGNVTVIGRTGASMLATLDLDEPAPRPGEAVRLDIVSSIGVFGGAEEYRVDWGDGNVTAWTSSSRFEHAYGSEGLRTARAYARNDAGQVAIARAEIDVGGTRETVLSRAFSEENQNWTFFFLGILGTAVTGGVGLLRRDARRRRYEKERTRIEELAQREAHAPERLERELAEATVRVRALVEANRIAEAHHTLLAARIGELRGRARESEVEHLLHRLPHGFVLRLREDLRDGRISRWERDALLNALTLETTISPEHKAELAARIRAWFAGDRAE